MQIEIPDVIGKAWTMALKGKQEVENTKKDLDAAKLKNQEVLRQVEGLESLHDMQLANANTLRDTFDELCTKYLAEGGAEPVEENPPVAAVATSRKKAS